MDRDNERVWQCVAMVTENQWTQTISGLQHILFADLHTLHNIQ